VIGVIKKEGESLLGISFDYQVIAPFNFARYILDPKSESGDPTIYAKARPNVTNAEMMDELTGILRGIRKLKPSAEPNFALNETSLLSRGFDGLFVIIGTAGWIIGGFSILVGGFGIANIMFVSVRERTNLIGIQKSLGAKNLFILLQFLSESVLLSFIGGFFGLVLTWIITSLGKDAMDIDISLTSTNIILGFTISILIGIISGFIPAYSASQLDPVEAIRTN
jgi:putative ABC transport system permease protein